MADRNRNKGNLKLLNFKKDCTISAMNVRTVRKKKQTRRTHKPFQ